MKARISTNQTKTWDKNESIGGAEKEEIGETLKEVFLRRV